MSRFTAHVDGGSRGNPGPAACAVILKEDGADVAKEGKLLGRRTNNQAEYEAVILALEKAKAMGIAELDIIGDSELIVHQMNRKYKVKHAELQPLFLKAWNLAQAFSRVTFTAVPREKNREADKLVNETLDAAAA